MINELIKLSDELDKRNLAKEADYLDSVIKKVALEPTDAEIEGWESSPGLEGLIADGTGAKIHPVQTVYATGQFQGIEVGTFQEKGATGDGEDVYKPNQFGLAVGYEEGSQIPPNATL